MTASTLRSDDEESMAWLFPPEDPADVDRWLASVEERVAEDVRSTLRRIVDDALTAFSATLTLTAAGDISTLDAIPDQWATYVRNDVGDVIGTLHGSGGLSAWFGSQKNPAKNQPVMSSIRAGQWADVLNEAAIDYQRAATNRLVGIGDSLWGDIRSRTVDGLTDGMSTEQVKKEIESITGFTEMRADTIARTETVSAYNAGEFEGARALGEFGPVEKQWLAANDRRTRESHAAADGQVQPFDQPFHVGGVLMQRPHDPGAPAGEVVNCRCVLLLLYPGDTRPDGSKVPDVSKAPSTRAHPPPVKEAPPPTGKITKVNRDGIKDQLDVERNKAGTVRNAQDALDTRISDVRKFNFDNHDKANFDAAWSSYKGGGHGPINRGLRSGDYGTETYKQHADTLQQLLAESGQPLPVKTVYRGVDGDPIGGKLRPGDVFTDRGFVSTAHDPQVSLDFSGNIGVTGARTTRTLYVIEPTPATVDVGVLPGVSSETEWILPPGSTFGVRDIVEYDTGYGDVVHRVVYMDWMGVAS